MSALSKYLNKFSDVGADLDIKSVRGGTEWAVRVARADREVAVAIGRSISEALQRAWLSCSWFIKDAPRPADLAEVPACPSGKITFDTEEAADVEATSLTRKNLRNPRPNGRTAARSYVCPHCKKWHLTSMEPDPSRW